MQKNKTANLGKARRSHHMVRGHQDFLVSFCLQYLDKPVPVFCLILMTKNMGDEDKEGMKNMPAFQVIPLDSLLGVIIIL